MAGDKAGRHIDLVLPVEGIEQSSANLPGRGGQFVEPVIALARQWCRRHIQIASEIERHGAVEEAAHGFYRATSFGRPAADPLEHLVDRVRIGEDVVGSFPVGMLVGGAKAGDPERCRIGQCPAEIGRRRTGLCRGLERVDDRDRIVSE